MEQNSNLTKRSRGPDTKPRKKRTDSPGRFLEGNRAIPKGRRPGSVNGWLRWESELAQEVAAAEGKLILRAMEHYDFWPNEQTLRQAMETRHPELIARFDAMRTEQAKRWARIGKRTTPKRTA
jgi:hypothetical protein